MVLSSLPRLLCAADGIVTLLLYLTSGIRDSYPAGASTDDPVVGVDRSVSDFLAYDFDHFRFSTSAADSVVCVAASRDVCVAICIVPDCRLVDWCF